MNKIRVIDLFNKRANGEEIPEKIKYNGEIYYLNDGNYSTYNKYGYLKRFFQWEWSLFEHLNDEIEIIEEDKKIKNIGTIYFNETPTEAILHRKIEEIIDYINKEDK